VGFVGACFSSKATVHFDAASMAEAASRHPVVLADGGAYASVACVPLVRGGRVVGVMQVRVQRRAVLVLHVHTHITGLGQASLHILLTHTPYTHSLHTLLTHTPYTYLFRVVQSSVVLAFSVQV
jgi:hypothetical protein